MTNPHGIDFGRYTTWARPANPPLPIDFLIAGLTSGNYQVSSYAQNVPALQQEERLMAYHFYEPIGAVVQADAITQAANEVGAKAIWLDWEDTRSHTLTGTDTVVFTKIYNILKDRFPRVGMYANHDDFWFFQQHNPDLANTIELWLAWPINTYNVADYHSAYRDKITRPFSSVRFFQYSWEGDAQLYGATNDKQSMDLDVFMGTSEELDLWLGIEPPPPPPPPTGCADLLKELVTLKKMNKEVREDLILARAQVLNIRDKIDELIAKLRE